MGQVLEFKRKEPEEVEVWQCDCGNQSFILCADGMVLCAACNAVQDLIAANFDIED